MWTSSTPRRLGSVAMAHPSVVVSVSSSSSSASTSSSSPRSHLDVEPAAARAAQRERRRSSLSAPQARQRPPAGTSSIASSAPSSARALAPRARTRTRAPTGTTWRRWPTLHARRARRAARRRARSAIATTASAIESSCISRSSAAGRRRAGPSPAGRRTPVSTSTMPGGSVRTSPISAACSQPGHARAARRAPRRRASGATNATSLPSLATYIGSMPSSSAAPATAGRDRHGRLAHEHRHARGARELVEHRGDAAARRVAHAAQRRRRRRRAARRRPATASACRTRSSASSSNSPRASMIAVPCSPIGPESEDRGRPGAARRATSARAGRARPTPVVQTYIPSAWPRSTTFVSPATISTPAAARRARRSPRPRRAASSASRPSSRIERQRQRQRPRARHGEVVDRAVDRQLADRAAGEADRLDDEAVGRQREAAPSTRRRRRRPARRACRDAERRHEQALDQRLRRLAAGAVGHRDALVAELRGRLARAVSMIPRMRCSRSATSDATAITRPPARARSGRSCSRRRRRPRCETMHVPIGALGRARGAEHLALPRLDDALEHLAALARLRVGDAHAGHAEAPLGVEVGVGVGQLQRRSGR